MSDAFVKINLINNDGEILEHHYLDADKWDLPGGRIEEGEMVRDAAARELFERTGYRIAKKELHLITVKKDDDGDFTYIYAASGGQQEGKPQTEIRWRKYEEESSDLKK